MWDDEDNFEDLEDDENLLVDIEEDDEEYAAYHRRSVLRSILIGVVGLIAVVAVFFILRHVLGTLKNRDDVSAVLSNEPVQEQTVDKEESGEAGPEGTATPEPTPTPAPTPTPTPEPTPTPIPEKYLIPGVDPGDLTAVREHIQARLDEIAADWNCPNIETITANEDCTIFTATCNSINESAAEQQAVNEIYELGRTYAAYAGTTVNNIRIDYRNYHGDLLYSRESGN